MLEVFPPGFGLIGINSLTITGLLNNVNSDSGSRSDGMITPLIKRSQLCGKHCTANKVPSDSHALFFMARD